MLINISSYSEVARWLKPMIWIRARVLVSVQCF